MTTTIASNFEYLYDKYSPILYSIALQVAPCQQQAEQILTETFTKAHELNFADHKSPKLLLFLMKLVVQTAHQQLNNGRGEMKFSIEYFRNTPILHFVIFEQKSLENYCFENQIQKECAMRKLRMEFSSIMSTSLKADL